MHTSLPGCVGGGKEVVDIRAQSDPTKKERKGRMDPPTSQPNVGHAAATTTFLFLACMLDKRPVLVPRLYV